MRLFCSCPGGLEAVVEQELHAQGLTDTRQLQAGVGLRTDLDGAYRALLHSRVASRVLLELAHFRARDLRGLYAGASRVAWEEVLQPGATFAVAATLRNARLDNPNRCALQVKDAIVDRLRRRWGDRPDVERADPDARIVLFVQGDSCTVYFDLAGSPLHHRDYRVEAGAAPLHPGLAAAMLHRAGWPELAARGAPLLDPFCGSGTLLVEAAWMAMNRAPGLLRQRWGFQGWAGHQPECWQAVHAAAQAAEVAVTSPILGLDVDAGAVRDARANLRSAGIEALVTVSRGDARTVASPGGEGLVITNPPYGTRLGDLEALQDVYESFGAHLKEAFGGWRLVLLTQHPELGRRLGMSAKKHWKVRVGALEARLLRIDVRPKRNAAEPGPAA